MPISGRDPRWGRTEECYGEDAWFIGCMAQAYVKGLQRNNKKYWMTASLMKHFLANSNENDRVRSTSDFDERLFREYYSLPLRWVSKLVPGPIWQLTTNTMAYP